MKRYSFVSTVSLQALIVLQTVWAGAHVILGQSSHT